MGMERMNAEASSGECMSARLCIAAGHHVAIRYTMRFCSSAIRLQDGRNSLLR